MSANRQNFQVVDSFDCLCDLEIKGGKYKYFNLEKAEHNGLPGLSELPKSIKILVENMLRHEDGKNINKQIIKNAVKNARSSKEKTDISFMPARILMQDFTGIPAIVDLASMRDAVMKKGKNPNIINPLIHVDLVIDHSIMVDYFASSRSLEKNTALDYQRNLERYSFLSWGASAFDNLTVIPPGIGICHQVNLEYFAKIVWKKEVNINGKKATLLYPDTLVGTDSHTTMVNSMSVLGWGVGGIEAEAAMLGQPISMLCPETLGVRIKGTLKEGVSATDLVLTITEKLRRKNVVGKFVEFCGEGIGKLNLEDRATISNMAPEYGATCGFFPTDDITIEYMKDTAREKDLIELVKIYTKANGLFRDAKEPVFEDLIEIDLGEVQPSIAGPKRPQDRIEIRNIKQEFQNHLKNEFNIKNVAQIAKVSGKDFSIKHGSVVIAAITSCTNTSNPAVMIAAGILARNASQRGIKVKPWVKTSLAPGSKVVSQYLEIAGLQKSLDDMGFNVVGYGCTTCIGNSGPLDAEIANSIDRDKIVVAAVLSGNRNFEGRIHPNVRANFLASPPFVVAYAIAGKIDIDFEREPIAKDKYQNDVYLKDIFPNNHEINQIRRESISAKLFKTTYQEAIKGDEKWHSIKPDEKSKVYKWDEKSTYIRRAPFLDEKIKENKTDIKQARILAVFADSITTDHISPAGAIRSISPAGEYLKNKNVEIKDFNSFGARRGNHEVMIRGTFANIRIKNLMLKGEKEGGFTYCYANGGGLTTIYDAAKTYAEKNVELVIFAGKEYGTGSSRDWAAKGTKLLGVKAVIAESFERIHRSNLVGMGVLPFVFAKEWNVEKAQIKGDEIVTIEDIKNIKPGQKMKAIIKRKNLETFHIPIICRIDTSEELRYFNSGGILPYVMNSVSA